MTKHYLLRIDDQHQDLDVPQMPFGHRIDEENSRFRITGYFACFDNSIKSVELLRVAENGSYRQLVNTNSEFVLYILEKKSRKLTVVIDQFGRFVSYFTVVGKTIYLSSSFSLVKNSLKRGGNKLTVDHDGLLTGIMWCWHNTEKTLIKEVRQVPAGSMVEFDLKSPKAYKISPLVDLETFLEETKTDQELSVTQFSNMWVDGLTQVISDRLVQFPTQQIGCDLSSGFDCTLVAYCLARLIPGKFTGYSRYSNLSKNETVLDLMMMFARTHGLTFKTLDITERQNYKDDLRHRWSIDDPTQLALTEQEPYLTMLSDAGDSVDFTGEGGDEVYQSREMDLLATFSMQQNHHFNYLHFNRLGTKEIFTAKCMDYALSEDRYQQRGIYPTIAPIMTMVAMMISEERYWEHGLWLMRPFMDTRIIGLARQMPRSVKGKKQDMKFEILRSLPEIFPKEMFRPKGTSLGTYTNFLVNQRSLIESVLEGSLVARLGWIDKDNIIRQLNNRNSPIYQGNITSTFETIIKLDWFLQANGIELS